MASVESSGEILVSGPKRIPRTYLSEMAMSFGETATTARSRYTHVFVEQDGRWRMVAAQGTQIAPPAE